MRTIVTFIMSLIVFSAVSQVESNTLTIKITGLESAEGKIGLRLLNENEEVVMHKNVDVTGTDMDTYFEDVPSGTYAVSYYHDENDNGELDFKWYGAPDEGTGNSNDVRGVFGPPNFEEQLFKVDDSMTMTMKTLYY
jgi:uncharacterized protein (DUF2141 family)